MKAPGIVTIKRCVSKLTNSSCYVVSRRLLDGLSIRRIRPLPLARSRLVPCETASRRLRRIAADISAEQFRHNRIRINRYVTRMGILKPSSRARKSERFRAFLGRIQRCERHSISLPKEETCFASRHQLRGETSSSTDTLREFED